MKIASEQEMLDFGTRFASNWNVAFRDHTRLTRSGTSEVSPVTTGANERVEKGTFQSPTVVELIGDVGAGKTTFVRGFAKGLGVKEPITSPSFTISKSYACANGKTLIHYDFYRLSDPGLMIDDLAEKIKNKNNIIILEWSNSVKDILPDNRTIIKISKNDDETRNVNVIDNRKFNARRVTALKGYPQNVCLQNFGGRKSRQDPSHALRLSLDTSTPTTILKLNNKTYKWHSDRDLAEKLLNFIHDKLQENNKDFHDITEIIFMSGPGSFTGLRIGATVVNTLAHELNIPLYTHKGQKVKIILPDYGRGANISNPKK